MGAQMKALMFAVFVFASADEQDPCAGCNTDLAYAHQVCAGKYGNACAERDSKGLVTGGPGVKKDEHCCNQRTKHNTCLECKTMDCQYDTCNVNKKYYSTYTKVPSNEGFSEKSMKAA